MDIAKYISTFIKDLSDNDVDNANLNIKIKQLINEVSPILNIGKLIIKITELNKVYDLDLDDNLIEFNNDSDYDSDYIEREFTIQPLGNVNIKCHPTLGYEFTNLDISKIEVMITLISTLYSNTLYSSYISQSFIYDSTTGLLNTSGLIKHGNILSDQGKLKNYAILFFNIQGFTLLNMRFGMEKTNSLLRVYSNSIKKFLEEDEFLARSGGDNFIAVVKKENVYDFSRNIGSISVDLKSVSPEGAVVLKNRIGVCPISEYNNITESIENSSIAMNIAKETRTNLIYFDNYMKDNIIKEKEIIDLFFNALRHKEFVVYYQPKVDLTTKSLCGSEALVRWKKDGKLVPPNDFIPILERERFICILDFYILKTVCEDIIDFLEKGMVPEKVSINFSKQNLQNPVFPKKILEILKIFGIESKYIEIELTETTNPTDYNTMIDFVEEMRKNKICVSIDDFGTGYSSVSTVKDLNVETVKVDKAFIDQLDKEKDRIVLKNIIRMLKELKMDVIAEGVETKEQIDILSEMGCQKMQGYYFDKPLEKKEYEKRLVNKKYGDN